MLTSNTRSSEVSSLPDPLLQPSIPLTGDSRADADIIAFYKARQKLIKKGKYLVQWRDKYITVVWFCHNDNISIDIIVHNFSETF